MSNEKEVSLMISTLTGVVQRVTTEVLTNPTAIMSKLLPVPPSVIPLSRKVSFVSDPGNSMGYGICAMDSIVFKTDTALRHNEEETIIPFLGPQQDGDLSLGVSSLIWKNPIPEIMCPVFIAEFDAPEGTCRSIRGCYLAFVNIDTQEFKAPPLPNVYPEGRLCTGDMMFRGVGILDAMPSVLSQWSANIWNRDLLNSDKIVLIRRHFCFDVKGDLIITDPEGQWFHDLPTCTYVPGGTNSIKETIVNEVARITKSS